MTVKELYSLLDARYPVHLRAEWDNDGLMLSPDANAPVRRVLVTLDVTEAATEYAVKNGYDLVISHHPLIFRPIGSLTPENAVPRKCVRLLQAGVSVFSFHTRLDAAVGGVNDCLASLLGLTETVPFGPLGEEMGRIGTLPSETTLADFVMKIKKVLGTPTVLFSDAYRPVRHVALLGGDGKDFVAAARAAGADTYISGRIGYNVMTDAPENAINLIEAGHFYTEHPVTEVLRKAVNEYLPDAEAFVFTSNVIQML